MMIKTFAIIILLIFIILIFFLFDILEFEANIENVSIIEREQTELKLTKSYITNYTVKPISINVSHPLLFENARWLKMPIRVFIDNKTCGPSQIKDFRNAMKIWETETKLISFVESEDFQIFVNCTEVEKPNEKYVKIGEAKPYAIFTGAFHLIKSANITIAKRAIECIRPIVHLHEIGHALGLGHSHDKKSIMYEIEDCDQIITKEIKETLMNLYLIKPLPDLHFTYLSAERNASYLNLTIKIFNRGLESSKNFILKINFEKFEKEFEISKIEAGEERMILVKNIFAPFEIGKIEIEIDARKEIEELDEENNYAILI